MRIVMFEEWLRTRPVTRTRSSHWVELGAQVCDSIHRLIGLLLKWLLFTGLHSAGLDRSNAPVCVQAVKSTSLIHNLLRADSVL